MSNYKCKLIPLERLLVSPQGIIEPLCNSCATRDCENPIQPQIVTVFGKNTDWRIYKKNMTASAVVSCAGYSNDR